ncbi:MAG: S-layer homology domain-containing protein [Synergistaceae bacterium]|nr:S-layer homology domain-containing protein [Synergistaceae bacterium]
MKKILAAVILAALVTFAAPAMADSNPFADVPAGHWSYDAVALLASRGVVSGYPDGQYKGGQLATRYEMASVVARALTKIDMEKASKEDLELIKKLVAEYKNELDALGVKVVDLDKRVAGLEKGLKGLHFKGTLWMDAEWRGTNSVDEEHASTTPSFSFRRARFFIEKQMDKDSYFLMRINTTGVDNPPIIDELGVRENPTNHFTVDRLWFSTKLPWNIQARFGYQTSDWDKEYGLWNAKYGGWGDEESLWTGLKFMGFDFRKDWGNFDLDFYVGRNTSNLDAIATGDYKDQAYMTYGLKLGFKTEKLKLGLFGRYAKIDGFVEDAEGLEIEPQGLPIEYEYKTAASNMVNYGVYVNYKIINGIEVKGTYNHQLYPGGATVTATMQDETDPQHPVELTTQMPEGQKNGDLWSIALEADQSLLKLFSFWFQYGHISDGYRINPKAFNQIGINHELNNFADLGSGMTGCGFDWYKFAIHRNFTAKLRAFISYTYFKSKGSSLLDATYSTVDDVWDFGVGLHYQYSPAVAFQAQYNRRNFGKGLSSYGVAANAESATGTDDVFRFRTILTF